MKNFIAFFALLGVAFAGHPSFKPYNTSAEMLFHGSDYNGDGVLSRDELDKSFAKYDSDADGRVSRHEYTIHLTQEVPSMHDFAHALYDDYDMTGDHHLNHQDYDMYYAKLDADGDGTVSETEFVNYWVDLFTRTEHLHGNSHGHGH